MYFVKVEGSLNCTNVECNFILCSSKKNFDSIIKMTRHAAELKRELLPNLSKNRNHLPDIS